MRAVLAIETSCDDTSVALIDELPSIRCMDVISQRDLHERFGGIVPENASRAHLEVLDPLVQNVMEKSQTKLSDIDAIAVTHTPGLVGSLLVGVVYAKALAKVMGKPCIGVHHLEGHLSAPLLALRSGMLDLPPESNPFPALALVVSGGHTNLFLIHEWGKFQCLGRTRDDAVGECFDKSARLMGLGYPGGPELNRLAEKHLTTLGMKEPVYHPKLGRSRVALPRPRPGNRWDDNLDFSFSGLKTAVKLIVQETGLPEENYPELALGLHEAVGEVFVRKLDVALEQYPVRSLWLTGGVACNSLLRSWLRAWCVDRNLSFLVAPPRLCTDNAAMIGYAALLRLHADALGIEPIEVEATSEVRSYN